MEQADLRDRIVAEARMWIDTPWSHQRRTKGVGVDCVGLPLKTAQTLGLIPLDVDIRDYERWPTGRLLDECRKLMIEIPRNAMQIADVPVLEFDRGPSHIGILAPYLYGGLSLIHANNDKGIRKVCEHRMTREWQERVVAAFRLPGVPA